VQGARHLAPLIGTTTCTVVMYRDANPITVGVSRVSWSWALQRALHVCTYIYQQHPLPQSV